MPAWAVGAQVLLRGGIVAHLEARQGFAVFWILCPLFPCGSLLPWPNVFRGPGVSWVKPDGFAWPGRLAPLSLRCIAWLGDALRGEAEGTPRRKS